MLVELVAVVLAIVAPEKVATRSHVCLGTEFGGSDDRWAGSTYRCLGIPTSTPNVRGVAHRWLPCHTEVTITRNGRTTTAKVIDRGPYGALLPKGTTGCPKLYGTKYPRRWCKKRKDGRFWVVKLVYSGPGTWQGCLDLTRKVARDIAPNSKPGRFYGRIRYRYDLPLHRRTRTSRGPSLKRPTDAATVMTDAATWANRSAPTRIFPCQRNPWRRPLGPTRSGGVKRLTRWAHIPEIRSTPGPASNQRLNFLTQPPIHP